MKSKPYSSMAFLGALLALCVIMLGAYTRLKEAGLGCPDWPGCYGQWVVPAAPDAIQKAQAAFPHADPVNAVKAWAEMGHRYVAGTLGMLIFFLAFYSAYLHWRFRTHPVRFTLIYTLPPRFFPWWIAGLLLFQAVLGMWTVTWQLLPLVVMGHLLGGMLICASLWWLALRGGFAQHPSRPQVFAIPRCAFWAILGMIIVFFQIALGGWTSANYASLICTDFPTCHGSLWPAMHLTKGFNLLSPIGINYQGGVLGAMARTAIHMMHRYGALVTTLYTSMMAAYLLFLPRRWGWHGLGLVLLGLLILQLILGVLNVLWSLPLGVAVLHNGVAVCLLLAWVTVVYFSLPVSFTRR